MRLGERGEGLGLRQSETKVLGVSSQAEWMIMQVRVIIMHIWRLYERIILPSEYNIIWTHLLCTYRAFRIMGVITFSQINCEIENFLFFSQWY